MPAPIELQVSGLPAGLQMEPTVIPAGQNQALLTFVAEFEADSVAGLVRVVGSGEVDGKQIVRRAVQPVVYTALALGAVAKQQTDEIAVAVSGRGAELALRGQAAGPLTPGGTVMLKFDVRRREGITGEVALRALNAPSGLSIAEAKVADGQQQTELALVAAADLKPGLRTLQIEGKNRC